MRVSAWKWITRCSLSLTALGLSRFVSGHAFMRVVSAAVSVRLQALLTGIEFYDSLLVSRSHAPLV